MRDEVGIVEEGEYSADRIGMVMHPSADTRIPPRMREESESLIIEDIHCELVGVSQGSLVRDTQRVREVPYPLHRIEKIHIIHPIRPILSLLDGDTDDIEESGAHRVRLDVWEYRIRDEFFFAVMFFSGGCANGIAQVVEHIPLPELPEIVVAPDIRHTSHVRGAPALRARERLREVAREERVRPHIPMRPEYLTLQTKLPIAESGGSLGHEEGIKVRAVGDDGRIGLVDGR